MQGGPARAGAAPVLHRLCAPPQHGSTARLESSPGGCEVGGGTRAANIMHRCNRLAGWWPGACWLAPLECPKAPASDVRGNSPRRLQPATPRAAAATHAPSAQKMPQTSRYVSAPGGGGCCGRGTQLLGPAALAAGRNTVRPGAGGGSACDGAAATARGCAVAMAHSDQEDDAGIRLTRRPAEAYSTIGSGRGYTTLAPRVVSFIVGF